MAELNGDSEDKPKNNTEPLSFRVEPFDRLPLESVCCDSCLDSPSRATKTCLTCLVSYFEAHLRPHLLNAKFQKHRLVDPLHDTDCRVCQVHHLPFMRFCLQDGCCVCLDCETHQHEGHSTISVREARSGIEVWPSSGSKKQMFRHAVEVVPVCRQSCEGGVRRSASVYQTLREPLNS